MMSIRDTYITYIHTVGQRKGGREEGLARGGSGREYLGTVLLDAFDLRRLV